MKGVKDEKTINAKKNLIFSRNLLKANPNAAVVDPSLIFSEEELDSFETELAKSEE